MQVFRELHRFTLVYLYYFRRKYALSMFDFLSEIKEKQILFAYLSRRNHLVLSQCVIVFSFPSHSSSFIWSLLLILFYFQNKLKDDTTAVIHRLVRAKLRTVMITGLCPVTTPVPFIQLPFAIVSFFIALCLFTFPISLLSFSLALISLLFHFSQYLSSLFLLPLFLFSFSPLPSSLFSISLLPLSRFSFFLLPLSLFSLSLH